MTDFLPNEGIDNNHSKTIVMGNKEKKDILWIPNEFGDTTHGKVKNRWKWNMGGFEPLAPKLQAHGGEICVPATAHCRAASRWSGKSEPESED